MYDKYFDKGVILENMKYNVGNFTVIELETTGLDTESGEMIKLTAVKFIGESRITFDTWIKPKNIVHASIKNFIGYQDEWIDNAPYIETVIDDFDKFLDKDHLVAHNAEFVITFLQKAYKSYLKKDFDHKIDCIYKLAKDLSKRKNKKCYFIMDIINTYCPHIKDIPPLSAENLAFRCYALGDAYKAMLQEYNFFMEQSSTLTLVNIK